MRLCKRRIYRGLFSQIEASFHRSLFTYRGLFLYTWKDAFIRDAFIYGTSHYMWHETWLIHMRHDSWLIHMRHDSFIWDMAHLTHLIICDMRHDSFIWDMTMTHLNESCLIFIWDISLYVTWLIYMRHGSFIWDMTHSYVTWLIYMRHDSFICGMPHS